MNATAVTDLPKSDLRGRHLLVTGARHPAQTRRVGKGALYAFTDILLAFLSGVLAYHIRFASDWLSRMAFLDHPAVHRGGPIASHFAFLLLYIALLILVCHAYNLYRPSLIRSTQMESTLVIRAILVATLLLMAFVYLSGIDTISRLVVCLTSVLSAVTMLNWRLCRKYLMRKNFAKGLGLRHALIVGAGRIGQLLADHLQENPILGYKVNGFLDANHNGDPRILGKTDDLARIARQEFIDEVFITIPSQRDLVKKIALEARQLNIDVKVVPELYDGLAWLSPLELVGGFPVRVLHREPIPAIGLFLKRLTDIMGSAFGLVLLSPIFGLLALAIKLDSPGPVFHRAYRVGKKGRKFLCYKFRTMVANAEVLKSQLQALNERQGPFFKIAADPRITRVGAFLRKYSLDELPQLWNVLKGEMSLVGPRPHPVDDCEQYTLEHVRRLDVTPGITCLWQISARHDPSFEKVLALDCQYIENWNYLFDLKILLKTVGVVVRGTGQ
jgi:exopolysaccharide biosynthesis polyprenyl glycosylphosphotransferase